MMDSQLSYSPDLLAMYTAFKQEVFDPKHTLYPSCGFDASPAKVFCDVTFVDNEWGNEGCIDELQSAGYRAFKQDIKDYVPSQPHDLLILLNPATTSKRAIPHLIQGGFVIVNDYHDNATELYTMSEHFELVGTIKIVGYNNFVAQVSNDISDLFEPCKTAAEFKERRPQSFDFMNKSYRHILSQANIDPAVDFETMYEQYVKFEAELDLKDPETVVVELPVKRVADRYIFRKL